MNGLLTISGNHVKRLPKNCQHQCVLVARSHSCIILVIIRVLPGQKINTFNVLWSAVHWYAARFFQVGRTLFTEAFQFDTKL